jgi:hypothetical protein
MAPVKHVEPVNSPWVSPLGYDYNPKISDIWLYFIVLKEVTQYPL